MYSKRKKLMVLILSSILMTGSLSSCAGRSHDLTSVSSQQDLTELSSSETQRKKPYDATREQKHRQESWETVPQQSMELKESKVIVLDPGHAATRTTDYEPVGPGAQETKMASVIGTRGVVTGVYEFARVLEISKLLREELLLRGYQVIMTKETNEEVLSNIQRAQIANGVHADAFLRIHADASEIASDTGAMAMCITESNPYVPQMYRLSRILADDVLAEYCAATCLTNRGVTETDEMTGNNWSEVPCILMELGYMTNPDDDRFLASAEGQAAVVQGIANGLDRYFNNLSA